MVIEPGLQPLIQCVGFSSENKDDLKPAFRKEVATVIVYNIATIRHTIFKFVNDLREINKIMRMNNI